MRHLKQLSAEKIDYPLLLKEINHWEKSIWKNNSVQTEKEFRKLLLAIKEITAVQPKNVEVNRECSIKLPNSIDDITFMAMLELEALLKSTNDASIEDLIVDVVTIVCFSANNTADYDSNSNTFKQFKTLVEHGYVLDILGLFNWINKAIDESAKFWNTKFLEVQVEDKDYEQAGGHRMANFNVIATIRAICSDFNRTDDQAWQLSYAIVQTNSLSKATATHVEYSMSKIKETAMRAKQRH